MLRSVLLKRANSYGTVAQLVPREGALLAEVVLLAQDYVRRYGTHAAPSRPDGEVGKQNGFRIEINGDFVEIGSLTEPPEARAALKQALRQEFLREFVWR